MIAEQAALVAAEAAAGEARVATGLDLRFLASGREGPIRTSALALGPADGDGSMWRVVLRDRDESATAVCAPSLRAASRRCLARRQKLPDLAYTGRHARHDTGSAEKPQRTVTEGEA